MQVWDDLFRNIDKVGRELVEAGVIPVAELEEWLRASKKDKSKMLSVGLPSVASLNNVIHTAKAGVGGILLCKPPPDLLSKAIIMDDVSWRGADCIPLS